MVKFLLSQSAMSINHQGRDGHTGDSLHPSKLPRLFLFTCVISRWFSLLLLFSPAQCLFPWPHPPGAVLAGQRGRHEPGCLRSQQVQWGERRANLPDVGLWKRSVCMLRRLAVRKYKPKLQCYCFCVVPPQVTMPLSPYWNTTNVQMTPPAMSTPSQEVVSHPSYH